VGYKCFARFAGWQFGSSAIRQFGSSAIQQSENSKIRQFGIRQFGKGLGALVL
jgi:hypothetical protein